MWPAVQAAADPHGLLGLSGTSPTVGVAGYTFSGGVGWFVRKHGLAAAALRSVEYVDGAGRLRHAAEDAPESVDREALWAFRGGAPVGVATSIDIGLVPVPDLWTGYLLWPEDMPAVASAWAAATAAVSESVTSSLSLSASATRKGRSPTNCWAPRWCICPTLRPTAERTSIDARRGPRRGPTRRGHDGAGDVESLARIHLDPPAAVPARGDGRWLSAAATDVLVSMFDAARIGDPAA